MRWFHKTEIEDWKVEFLPSSPLFDPMIIGGNGKIQCNVVLQVVDIKHIADRRKSGFYAVL
jgi:hypothetical protein